MEYIVNECFDLVVLVRVEPMDGVVATEPRQLLFGVDTGVLANTVERHFQRPLAVKVVEEFFEAYGIKAIEIAPWHNLARLFYKALLHHHADALIDAGEEFVTIAIETNLNDTERPRAGMIGRVRTRTSNIFALAQG